MIKYLIKISLVFLLTNIVTNGYADDPYCEQYFDGNAIAINPAGSPVHTSPDKNSDILFTLPYDSIIQACWWDIFPDTINNIPGNWRKVKSNDIIGYIFSTDCLDFNTSLYATEKLVPLIANGSISYRLSYNFFGVFETNNGDSLLECNIKLNRFTTDEIYEYNLKGPYEARESSWYYITTDKPYKCKVLFTTKNSYSPTKIYQFSYDASLNYIGKFFKMEFPNCDRTIFSRKEKISKTKNGYDIVDNMLTIETGREGQIDTIFSCNNCGIHVNLKFDFLGDINNDKKVDFMLIRSGGEGIIRKLYISQGLNSRYRMINEY